MRGFWDRPSTATPPKRRRVIIVVEADLDQMPGWLHDPEDWATWIANKLAYLAPTYNTAARAVAIEHTDGTITAIL